MIWVSQIFCLALVPARAILAFVSATNVTNSVHQSNSFEISCQENPHAASIPISDYFFALQEILTLPDAMTPVPWRSSDPSRGKIWSSGRASINLQATQAGSSDIFQPVLIARTAALIGQKCMTAQHQYRGGLTLLGDRAQFFLTVTPRSGADADADDGQGDKFS